MGFGVAIFLSYQSIIQKLDDPQNNLNFQNVGYVVLDEAHFFISDAKFNSQTETILVRILNQFKFSTRIYMTATPEQVLNTIIFCENICFNNKQNTTDIVEQVRASISKYVPGCYWYSAISSYKNYDFYFFKSWDVISDRIINSVQEDKWVIFIKNKDDYNEIETYLKVLKVKKLLKYIDADKKDTVPYMDIVANEQFKKKVLVTTSTLDNGVNFKDSNLKHIVVDTLDPVTAIQMIGRKRLEDGENVSVYFKIPESTEVSDYLKRAKYLTGKIHQYENYTMSFFAQNWGNISVDVQKLFFPCWETYTEPPMVQYNNNSSNTVIRQQSNYSLKLNTFAKTKLEYEIAELSAIKDELDENDSTVFPKRVLRWFKKSEDIFSENMIMTIDKDAIMVSFNKWLEENIGRQFNRVQLEKVYSEFIDFCRKVGCSVHKYNEERVKKNTNALLKELDLPYEFYKLNQAEINQKETKKWDTEKIELWEFRRRSI